MEDKKFLLQLIVGMIVVSVMVWLQPSPIEIFWLVFGGIGTMNKNVLGVFFFIAAMLSVLARCVNVI